MPSVQPLRVAFFPLGHTGQLHWPLFIQPIMLFKKKYLIKFHSNK